MGVRDSAHGLADWGGGSQSQKGGPESVLELSWYHTTQPPGESLCQSAGKKLRPLVEPQIQVEQCGLRLGRGTVDQLFTLARLLEGSWEFAQPFYMGFVDLEKAFNKIFFFFVGVLREYGVPDSVQRAIRSLYACSKSCVCILGIKSDPFPVSVGLRQGCPLSLVLFGQYI